MVPANDEPIRITVEYVDVNGEAGGGYEVMVPPRRRFGLSSWGQGISGKSRW
jgi:hypothetical protein